MSIQVRRRDPTRRVLAGAAPFIAVVLTLLSMATLWFAALIHSAPLQDAGGVISWQGEVELTLAYVNFGWIALILVGYWLGRVPLVLAALAAFVLNYCAWIVMVAATPI